MENGKYLIISNSSGKMIGAFEIVSGEAHNLHGLAKDLVGEGHYPTPYQLSKLHNGYITIIKAPESNTETDQNLTIEPQEHPDYEGYENPIQSTGDYDKLLNPPKVKKQKMQTFDLTNKLQQLKKSRNYSSLSERLYNYYNYLTESSQSGLSWLRKSERPDDMVMSLAKNGFWKSAMETADKIKRNPMYSNIYSQLASMDEKVPPEHFKEFVSKLLHPWDHNKNNTNAIFELAHNLHPNLSHEHLDALSRGAVNDYFVKENILTHPGWAPHQDQSYIKKFIPYAFWNSYEKAVRPEHFQIFADAHGQSLPISHRGVANIDNNHSVLNWSHAGSPSDQNFSHVANPGVVFSKQQAQIPVKDIGPLLADHAKDIQTKLLDSYYKGNPHNLQLKTFGGKQYIKLYRGIGGEHATKILEKFGHNKEDNTVQNRTLKAPAAPFSSWSHDKDMARRFANARGDHLGGDGLVMEKWHPIEHVMHSGFIQTHPMMTPAHENEYELIIKHPSQKQELKSTDLHILKEGELVKPNVIKKA